ncbi:MAG: DUF1003 domain-containing protein [Patescibacteria group bacterium]
MSFLKKHATRISKFHKDYVKRHREKVKSFKAKMNQRRSLADKFADFLTQVFGTITVLGLNMLFFAVWIVINLDLVPGIASFDPFPFGLLTMIVSLEAIFLAIVVLISQNRGARIQELREEIDLQINVRAEEEITKILVLLDKIHDHLGLPAEDDEELVLMKQKTNLDELEKELSIGI